MGGRPTIPKDVEAKLRVSFDAGDRPVDAFRKVTGIALSTVYDRYSLWRGGPRRYSKHRKSSRSKPVYTGPDWIGKAITK